MLRLIKTGNAGNVWTFVFAVMFMFAFMLGTPAFGADDVEVTAQVDRTQLSPDDTLQLAISVSSSSEVSISQPTLPPLNDFEILNEWTSNESRTSFTSGRGGMQRKTVQTTNYNFLLQPKREGTLSIGGVEVVVDGRPHVTKPISLKVAKGITVAPGTQPRGGAARGAGGGGQVQLPPGFQDEDDADDLFAQLLRRGMGVPGGPEDDPGFGGSRTLPVNPNDAFFVQVETDKKEAYVGEQVTVSFYLYTRGVIRDLDTLKYPSLKGFWKEDIEIATHLNFVNEVVNGLPYKKALLASFALFPIKDGVATIDEYKAKCSVSLDPLGGMGMGKAYTYTKSSSPVKINVKPLPVEGRPADFSGAVGDFQVTASVEDKNVVSNQPFTYKVRFEGRGNAKLIELPPFNPPEGLEQYDTQKDSKFFRTGTSYKDFSIQLIPRREGEFTLPPLTVSIFDPRAKAYVQRTTEAVRVIVAKGAGPAASDQMMKDGGGTAGGSTKEKVDAPPQLMVELKHPVTLSFREFAFSFPVMLTFMLIGLGWKAKNELGWGAKKADLQRRLRARLRRVDAKVTSGDWRGVGVEMTNAVYFVLGEITGEGGASTELDKLMKKAPPSVRRELSVPLAKQMDIFQVLSFAPESVVGDLKSPERLRVAVAEMGALMEKAVQLGLSSGQTEESGS
jgi:hypothetical protein